jgi:Flp pilus assembly protein TadD
VFFLVALAAVIASGVVVIGVLATRSEVPTVMPRPGAPQLNLDFGLRTDQQARALLQAENLYNRGGNKQRQQAGATFKRYDSLEAQIGAAFAAWPADTLRRLQTLAAENPKSSVVALHLGLALYWSRRDQEADTAWRAAEKLQPDTPYAVRAEDFLHPRFFTGRPTFVPSFEPALQITPTVFDSLRRKAATGGVRARLLYGVALQRLGRPVSAEREFAAAASLSPTDAEARTAEAVGLFDKDDPSNAFSRLGPLVRVFPHAQTVRFHLGLMLVWMGQVRQARAELQTARAEGPKTVLGKQAAALLRAINQAGTR